MAFAFLGCAAFILAQVLFRSIIELLGLFIEWPNSLTIADFDRSLVSIGIGLLGQHGFRLILQKNWENNPKTSSGDKPLDNLD